ncbi:MAG: OmpA family protein [Erythrobacter sp.]|uniref:OmpA family protein n=1 Tax=Erythrobacter sp. TaxID=1042 RepID=UPI003264991E
MRGLSKALLGAGAASLLAVGTHYANGAGTIDKIETDASAALAEAGVRGVDLSIARDPLSRNVTLSGISDPDERARIEGILRKSSNVGAISWEGELDIFDAEALATGIGNTEAITGASAEQIAACQQALDSFKEGKTILFDTGSADLSEQSLDLINSLARRMNVCTGMRINVGGHTDATGTDEVNLTISQARADAVAAELTNRSVAGVRIIATGYGSSQPLVEDAGENAANRRIEFTLDDAAAEAAPEGEG